MKAGDAELFHVAPLVMLKIRGLPASKRKAAVEAALCSHVASEKTASFEDPLLAFAFSYLASHFGVGLLEESVALEIMEFVEKHRGWLLRDVRGLIADRERSQPRKGGVLGAGKQPDLESVLAGLVRDGARTIEVEFDRGDVWVSVVEGNTALGVTRYRTPDDRERACDIIGRLRKEKTLHVSGGTYRLSFKMTENSGEPTWTLRVAEKKECSS